MVTRGLDFFEYTLYSLSLIMDSNSGKKVAAEALISRFEITKLLKQGKLSQHHNPPHNTAPTSLPVIIWTK
jgi:hypothetical protein